MVNDTTILISILIILISVGLMVPFLNETFNAGMSTPSVDDLGNDLGEEVDSVSASSVLTSLARMFIWSWDIFPFWLNGFFWVLRITFYFILFRTIRSGGG